MREALRARDRLRWAERLQRKKLKGETRFTRQEEALLEDLAAGTLHDAADSATRKSGWGRIKHPDGSFEEVSPQCGLIVRTLLDDVDSVSTDDERLDVEPCSFSGCCTESLRVEFLCYALRAAILPRLLPPLQCEVQKDALPAAILLRLLSMNAVGVSSALNRCRTPCGFHVPAYRQKTKWIGVTGNVDCSD